MNASSSKTTLRKRALLKKVFVAAALLLIGFGVAAVKISLDAPVSLPVDI